jgi:hypothetical protein
MTKPKRIAPETLVTVVILMLLSAFALIEFAPTSRTPNNNNVNQHPLPSQRRELRNQTN